MKVFVVIHGSYVIAAFQDLDNAKTWTAVDDTRYQPATDHLWVEDMTLQRWLHEYKAESTGRWNKGSSVQEVAVRD